jgi:hypothetical protein
LFLSVRVEGLVLSGQVEEFRSRFEKASSYAEVWEIVKDSVQYTLGLRRDGMMLFLDDLPVRLGAYHPVGTNNIVLNRVLIEIVEASSKERRVVNALVYILLLHEYLHSLGEYSEERVKGLVVDTSKKCFGDEFVVTSVAVKSPWALLNGIPLGAINARRHVIEIVKDFEKTDEYIV